MGGPLTAAGGRGDGGAKAVEPLRPPPPPDPKTMARWYQLEALERAVRGNTLAFLETGSGKTLIAVMLLRAYAHRVRRPDSRRFAVFLVPTVVLVGQQARARVVEQHTDLVVKQFCGEMGVDFWDAATWRSQLEDGEVLVMTPQILLDNLRHSFFRLQDIALLIFDECHHARGNTPYACIFKEFYHPQLNSSASDPLPRIFGMSASLIYSKDLNPHNYSKQISEIENLMNSKHIEALDRKLHGSSLENAKQRISKLHHTFVYCLYNLGVWLAAKAAEVQSYEENSLSFWGETLDKNVEGFIRNYSEEVHRELSCFLKNADSQDGILTPKVHCLIRTLLQYRYFKPLPRFDIDKASGTCTLHLPKSSPVQTTVNVEGEGSILKETVCLKACQELHAIGALTDSLLPELDVPCDEEPDIVVENKIEQPSYFPEEFVDNWRSFSRLGIYYCYKISLEGCPKTASPTDILLALKCDLGSDFTSSSFKLPGGQDNASVTMKYVGIIHLNQEQVIIARRFQTTILSFLIGDDHLEVSNGIKYFHEMQVPIGVVYLLLPLVSGRIDWCSMKFSSSPIYEANNKHMTHCHSCKDIDLLQTKDGPFCRCILKNSIVCTPHNNIFYVISGFLDLDANSCLPQHDGTVVTYKDYFKTRHGLTLTFENQPLLAGSKHVKVRNFLHNCYSKKEKEPGDRYSVELPPELCRIIMSPVSANNLHIFSYVPSIMFRIQCMLLSVKLKVQLGPTVQQFDVPILEALTTKKCQEEFSQESLETLGDSFLKYVTTRHLFSEYRLQHEGILTKMKKNLISNAALCQLACSSNLVGYIHAEEFNPRDWIIPCLDYDERGNKKISFLAPNGMYSQRKMSIKSKRIADSVEALIGAYLSTAGEKAAFLLMKSLGMNIEFHTEIPVERKISMKAEEFINVRSLEGMLGYKFNDSLLLLEALTHGSYQTSGPTSCYQRLEFLGDAILDHLFTEYYYSKYPDLSMGQNVDLSSLEIVAGDSKRRNPKTTK
uniref:Dicer-like protein n=1 Tax=Oryza rufipogon TaxID=4529 RepID=A0A0E0NXL7_ORYRU